MSQPDNSREFLDILRSERRDLLNRLRQTRLSTLKPGFSHAQLVPHATYAPWLDDDAFIALHERIRTHTLVDVYRCHELYSLARQAAKLPGEIVEIGVWRGGTAALLAGAAPGKTAVLFDTFSGVAKPDARFDTLYRGGEHADTDRATVAALFASLGLKCTIHAGIFPDDTISGLPQQICLAHVDVDTHGSAKGAYEAIWPRLSVGGMMVFDDYGFFGCEGVTQLVRDIVDHVHGALLIHNLNGHGILVKQAHAA